VHLAIDPGEAAVAVEHDSGVVIQAGGAPLEQRADDDEPRLAREPAQPSRAGPRHGLGKIEGAGLLALAEVGPAVQLRQQREAAAGGGGGLQPCLEIGADRLATAAEIGLDTRGEQGLVPLNRRFVTDHLRSPWFCDCNHCPPGGPGLESRQ
jgi:hypothetical protein